MAQPRDFGFGPEEQMLRDQARKFLDEHASVEKLRNLVATNPDPGREPVALYDEGAWKKIVALGWPALAVPEEAGGVGMKTVAVAALAEEVGRHAFASPLIATMLSTFVLSRCSGPEAGAALGKIAEGQAATLAVSDAWGSWDPADTDVTARAAGGGLRLSGTASFVQDARKVDFFVVSASSEGGVGLYVVPKDVAGLTIRADRIVDLTRDQARVNFDGVALPAGALVAPAGKGAAALVAALPSIWTIVAADMTGAAEWQLQTTVEYAKVREQFGRPIGFFQAVKHPLVNVMIEIDKARSLVYNAACAIDTEPERAETLARMAKAQACDAAAFASDRSLQLHGGIGFTWECDLHLYFKRQKHNQFLFGDALYHRRKLADLILG